MYMRAGFNIAVMRMLVFCTESFSQSVIDKTSTTDVFVKLGDVGVLSCKHTPDNIAIQWIRLNPTENITQSTYADGWTVNQEIPHHNRISIISSINSTKYDLQIVNVTTADSGDYRCLKVTGNKAQPCDVRLVVKIQEHVTTGTTIIQKDETTSTPLLGTTHEADFGREVTVSTVSDIYENATNTKSTTRNNTQTILNTDFLNNGIYWVVGMTGSGIVVFITVFLSYVYIKKLNAILNKANQEHTISIEYREEQTNNIDNDDIEIYERSENVRENTHARSATRIERRTINNEVYEIVQQHEPSPNIQTDHLTQDEENRSYQTVSANWSNDDHIYKELSGGQC